MKKILLGGAGGAPTNNVIKSLRNSGNEFLVGTSCNETDLLIADVDERYWVPHAIHKDYKDYELKLLKKIRPDFVHYQHDFEILSISSFRREIEELGIKLYLPSHDVIENCVDKAKSYQIWRKNGIKVPETILLNDESDLKKAFTKLGDNIWIRATKGGGGRGALPTDNYEFAKIWIDYFNGWGEFVAAEYLSKNSVTWMSIFYKGELVVAQTRKRESWNFGNRTLSGVTGITGVGLTINDNNVTQIALDSIFSVDNKPHGIYSVDMTYDANNIPNPTEINIGRFFTTVYFFTKAGVNFPRIYVNIALYNDFPSLEKKINPLQDGLRWIRGMDHEPVLINETEYLNFLKKIHSA
ncbi:carboxylate--amine ligase [Bacteroidota bacterium]